MIIAPKLKLTNSQDVSIYDDTNVFTLVVMNISSLLMVPSLIFSLTAFPISASLP